MPGPNRRPPAATSHRSLTPSRKLAQTILLRVAEQGAHAAPLLNAAIARQDLAQPDAAWLTELVYGTLRHQGQLELRLQRHLRAPFARLPPPVQTALRAAAYQLLHMRVPPYTAVDATVELLRRKFGRLAALANAVLRRLAEERDHADAYVRQAQQTAPTATPTQGPTPQSGDEAHAPADLPALVAQAPGQEPQGAAPTPGEDPSLSTQAAEALAAQTSHPAWLVARWHASYGAATTRALLAANNVRPPLSLRVNTRRCTRDDLLARLRAAGFSPVPSPALAEGILLQRSGDVRQLPGYVEGHFVVQDMAPALVAHLLPLTPDEAATIVDLCAAPGGKTTHLAERLAGRGQVLAVDAHPGRLGLVVKNATRLGHGNVVPVLADARDPAALAHALKDAGVTKQVDHVLLDPPCSGSGTLRRHPELRRKSDANLAALCAQQAQLLRVAADLVAPNGNLIFAVCSLLPEEGSQQVEAFLRERTDFALVPPPAALAPWTEGGCLQTWPHVHQLDGFFAARLVRQGAP